MAVSGIAAMKAKLARMPDVVQKRARDAMEKGADEIVAMMKRLAPDDTGKLRNSIGWTWGSAPAGSVTIGTVGGREYKTMRITIYAGDASTMVENSRGVQFQNARLQEFGTQKMEANPFFFTSYRTLKDRTKRRVVVASRKALKELAASGS